MACTNPHDDADTLLDNGDELSCPKCGKVITARRWHQQTTAQLIRSGDISPDARREMSTGLRIAVWLFGH